MTKKQSYRLLAALPSAFVIHYTEILEHAVAGRLIEAQVVDAVARETVRQTLKK